MLPRLALTFALAVFAVPGLSHAQAQPPTPQPAVETQQYDAPAYVSAVDGSATLERDGRIESAPLNMPLLTGDRLKTADGRVEVRFADGGRLHLDNRTSVDVLSEDLVRLGDGRIRLSMQRSQQVSYRIDSSAGSVRITQPGEYRIAIIHGERETQIEFAVIRGAGEIFTDQGSTPVHSGERAYASAGLLPSYAYSYNSATMDEFDRWSEMQYGTVYAATSDSSRYLPSDMGTYASTFDQYGDWRYQQTYGYVWYPRVATGWRPYYYGRWAPYPTYGWTWITGDPFGYPTHHYGRWGFSANAWFWIPSRYWGPAYVSWGYAPSYVSWCPLGWNNAAVFSIGYYNVGPGYYAGHYRGHYYSAWTTVPHGYFGRGYYAHQYAVNWDRAGYTGARPQFTEARVGPSTRDIAVPRNSAPLRFAGTRAAPAATGFAGGRNAPGATARTFDTGQVRAADGARVRTGARVDPSGTPAADTPRYINRGDQIVRSQTERATPPPRRTDAPAVAGSAAGRDMAISRGMPQTSPSESNVPRRTEIPFSGREGRATDHPDYRPSPSAGQVDRYRAYDRAIPRVQQGAPSSVDRQAPPPMTRPTMPTMPTTPPNDAAAAGAGGSSRPYPGGRVYQSPYGGDRAYGSPSVGERAYGRPSGADRAYERPGAGGGAAPAPAARPMERSGPPPSAGRPMERAPSPPPPPAAGAPRSGGGDRAVPRGGGNGGGAPSGGHRGGGRTR